MLKIAVSPHHGRCACVSLLSASFKTLQASSLNIQLYLAGARHGARPQQREKMAHLNALGYALPGKLTLHAAGLLEDDALDILVRCDKHCRPDVAFQVHVHQSTAAGSQFMHPTRNWFCSRKLCKATCPKIHDHPVPSPCHAELFAVVPCRHACCRKTGCVL